jgi:hypothetical protein
MRYLLKDKLKKANQNINKLFLLVLIKKISYLKRLFCWNKNCIKLKAKKIKFICSLLIKNYSFNKLISYYNKI